MRILLIEDEPTTAKGIELMLSVERFNVYTTDLGEEALDLGKLYDYDIICLDLSLPDMNGYDVARLLRSEPCGQDAILVAVTGWGQDKDRQMASDAGFDLHLTKPVDFYELDAVLQKMLQAE